LYRKAQITPSVVQKLLVVVQKLSRYQRPHRETIGLMLTNFRVGDRVEDKKTHKRGRITFVYSELERKGEVIEVLFDGRDEAVDVPADDVRKVSTRRS
jgi:hypothetical protein